MLDKLFWQLDTSHVLLIFQDRRWVRNGYDGPPSAGSFHSPLHNASRVHLVDGRADGDLMGVLPLHKGQGGQGQVKVDMSGTIPLVGWQTKTPCVMNLPVTANSYANNNIISEFSTPTMTFSKRFIFYYGFILTERKRSLRPECITSERDPIIDMETRTPHYWGVRL